MESAQIRRYRILEVLGSGGFGTVYRAEMSTDSGLRREVALKVLNEDTAGNAEAARRLRDEARILSNLNHYGIVRVDDLLQLEGRWTMVMELVNGVDTERLLQAHGPMPLSVSLEVVAEVAQTLNAAWRSPGPEGRQLGLIHRDIKPANILVTATGGVKLLDFGVARAEIDDREAHTQAAFVMGSLPYLAPERYAFEDLHAGDVYSLGCVLYELLTTRRFGRTRPSEKRHMNKVRQGLHELWEQLPGDRREEVLQILADTLTYDPEHRPSARRLAARVQELRHLVSGPGMVEWAEQRVVPVLAAGPPSARDAMCGRVLTHNLSGESIGAVVPSEEVELDPEELEPEEPEVEAPTAPLPTLQPEAAQPVLQVEPVPPVPPVPATVTEPPPASMAAAPADVESAHWPALLLALGAGAFAVMIIVMVAMSAQPTPQEPTAPVKASGPSLEEVLDDLSEEEEFPEPAPVEETPAPRQTGPAILVNRETPPPKAPEPVEEPALPTGRVIVEGDADFVKLRGPGGTADPGEVPVGTWTLFPSFPGGYTVKGPTITVVEGQTLRLRCSSGDRTCEFM